MNNQVDLYIERYPEEIRKMFQKIRQLIWDHTDGEVEEKLWAGLPSYYIGESFIRLIPFKNHINIEAKGVEKHRNELTGYKITPKGMMQIFIDQDIPVSLLKKIFMESFTG